MSQQTIEWLNLNTLIGFTDKRGKAWHYRADKQGEQNNHYPGAIPVEDVRKRLFHWKPIEGSFRSQAHILTETGVETLDIIDVNRKTIIRPDLGVILGAFKKGYKIHDYDEWLIQNVEFLLDDALAISSAGLLNLGGIAWVEISVPDTIVTPEGVAFRPNLLAATSLDGSLSSTYKRTVQMTVCDNTMGAALAEPSPTIKVRHSRNSIAKLADVKEALDLVYATADNFTAEVAQLCNTTVTDSQWDAFLADLVKMPEDEGRGKTLATSKVTTLNALWNSDERVSPWKNTAFGVVQAVNTATHHSFTVRGGTRADRNMMNAVTGKTEANDRNTLEVLAGVLA